MKQVCTFLVLVQAAALLSGPQQNHCVRGVQTLLRRQAATHDYVRGDDGSARVDVAAVDELLAERIYAKRGGDFQKADDLRDVLSNEHNVKVWDKERTWTVGGSDRLARNKFYDQKGGSSRDGGDRSRDNSFAARRVGNNYASGPAARAPITAHDYTRDANDASEVDVARVDALLLERLQAKFGKRFERADELRDELQSRFGVRVHDERRTWTAGVSPGAADPWRSATSAYARAPSPHDASLSAQLDVSRVQRLVDERLVARKRKHWAKADEILEDLLQLDVHVDDKALTWTTVRTVFERAPEDDADLDLENIRSIEALLAKRTRCKLRREFDKADAVRDELKDRFSVAIDDRKRQWRTLRKGRRAAEFGASNADRRASADRAPPRLDDAGDPDDTMIVD